jgi:hypothetical protein
MTMSKQVVGVEANDSFELGTARTITPEGFLEAPAAIARTGVQLYRARELGLDKHGLAGDRIVRLHRPAEELFNPETIATFHNKPVINGSHKTVTAENWKELSVGDMHHPEPSGKVLVVKRLSVKDKSAVDDVQSGKKFLSIGYKFDIDLTPGTNADGEAYDGVQRNIKGNHVLITDSPRGGPVCSIADTATVVQGERKMRRIIINNVPVEVGDSEAGIIEGLIAERDAARNQQPSVTLTVGSLSKTVTGSDAIVKEFEALNTQIAALKAAQITPVQIEEQVAVRVATVGDAIKLVENFEHKGKTNKQIHQEVLATVTGADAAMKPMVDAILAGKAVGDASEESLAIAFRALAASKPAVAAAVTSGVNGADAAMSAALMGRKETVVVTAGDATAPTGRMGFIERQQNAWKGNK